MCTTVFLFFWTNKSAGYSVKAVLYFLLSVSWFQAKKKKINYKADQKKLLL